MSHRAVAVVVVFFLLLTAVPLAAQSDAAFVQWARRRAIPIDALRKLDSQFAGARLIGMGESVHEVATFGAFRRDVFQYLVQRHRVTALVMETGLAEALAMDDYVKGHRDAIDFAVALPGLGQLAEIRATMEWIRAWNRGAGRAHPVGIYGADLPGRSGSFVPALDRLAELTAGNAEVAAAIEAMRPVATQIAATYYRGAAQKYEPLSAEAKAKLTADVNAIVAATNRVPNEWARRVARVLQQHEESLRLGMFAPTAPRDVALAENTLWIVARLPANERAVYWAHNAHVQKTPVTGPALPAGAWPASGTHFAAALGTRYLAIGTTYGGASLDEKTPPADGTVDAAMARASAKPFLLVLDAKRPKEVEAWLAASRPMRFQVKTLTIPLGEAFDVLAYFPAVTR